MDMMYSCVVQRAAESRLLSKLHHLYLALSLPKLTSSVIVISPLVSLMKSQVL